MFIPEAEHASVTSRSGRSRVKPTRLFRLRYNQSRFVISESCFGAFAPPNSKVFSI
ncbi:MAG: hypothetical protein LBJ00_07435 [Planctomycetaceae bacterium]|nr:hypothetical protein [Planctomycetaceae bacterium]